MHVLSRTVCDVEVNKLMLQMLNVTENFADGEAADVTVQQYHNVCDVRVAC